jgi:hypothetical protein
MYVGVVHAGVADVSVVVNGLIVGRRKEKYVILKINVSTTDLKKTVKLSNYE